MLLGGKSPKIIDLLEIELIPICRLKDILLISRCTFVILGYFEHKNVKDLWRDTAPLRKEKINTDYRDGIQTTNVKNVAKPFKITRP